jgi:oxygen-independent coproporphyrinogen-3 oxidase
VSFYGLTIEPGTRLHHWRAQGALPLPDDELQAQMYEQGLAAMEASGLGQYEISNFARAGREAVHNRLYWRNVDTLGLGAGAWSFVDGERSGRIKQPQAYIDALASAKDPRVEREALQGRDARAEEATLALRMNQGLGLADWKARHGVGFEEEFGAALAKSTKAGSLAWGPERVTLTPQGRLLSNQVFMDLL